MLAAPEDPRYRSGWPTTCRPAGVHLTEPPGWLRGGREVVVVDEVDVEGGGRVLADALGLVAVTTIAAAAIVEVTTSPAWD